MGSLPSFIYFILKTPVFLINQPRLDRGLKKLGSGIFPIFFRDTVPLGLRPTLETVSRAPQVQAVNIVVTPLAPRSRVLWLRVGMTAPFFSAIHITIYLTSLVFYSKTDNLH